MCALQAGNFLDKIVTFCVGMGIGEGLATPLHATCSYSFLWKSLEHGQVSKVMMPVGAQIMQGRAAECLSIYWRSPWACSAARGARRLQAQINVRWLLIACAVCSILEGLGHDAGNPGSHAGAHHCRRGHRHRLGQLGQGGLRCCPAPLLR